MLNQIVLVGRLTKDLEVKENEEGKKYTSLVLAVPRIFKNNDGEYEKDFIECSLWEGIAENTANYCHAGDIIGVKGRLQSIVKENVLGEKTYSNQVVAERVTYLSSKSSNINESEEE